MSMERKMEILRFLRRVRRYEQSGIDVHMVIENGYVLYYIVVGGVRRYFDGVYTMAEYHTYQDAILGMKGGN